MKISKFLYIYLYFRRFARKMNTDHVSAYSAQSAFFIFLSFFPFIMLFASLIQFLPFTQEQLSELFGGFMTPTVDAYVKSIISEIYSKASGAVISITTVAALWSASRGLLAVIRGLNSVYGVEEKRGYIRLRISMTFYTLLVVVLLLFTLGLLVFGKTITDRILNAMPYLRNYTDLILSLRWLVILAVLIVVFTLMFVFMPKRKTTFFKELPGAVLCAFGWLIFSAIYSYYVDNIANFSYFYGSLATLVFLMLWLYFCMYILFFGAEFNVALADDTFMPEFKSWLKSTRTKLDITKLFKKRKKNE